MSSRILVGNFFFFAYILISSSAGGQSGCSRRVYITRAVQQDQFGKICWDIIKFASCGGRCDSSEVADWEFPFKISRHPVCVHRSRRPISVRLRHCDPDVEPGTDLYHYIAAEDCHCQKCSSKSTSCEWLPPNSTLVGLDSDNGVYKVNALSSIEI